jgi:hypothetical protein
MIGAAARSAIWWTIDGIDFLVLVPEASKRKKLFFVFSCH